MEESGFKFLGYRVPKIVVRIEDAFYGQAAHNYAQQIGVSQRRFADDPQMVEVSLASTISDAEKTLSIEVNLAGGFRLSGEFDEKMLNQLAEINAPAILYPFLRSLIATFTAQAGIPTILLPTMNFAARRENQQESVKV